MEQDVVASVGTIFALVWTITLPDIHGGLQQEAVSGQQNGEMTAG
jgi:hypothetical protein